LHNGVKIEGFCAYLARRFSFLRMNPLLVVTGGSKGIGRALVETFVAGGFDAVVCARNETDLNAFADELRQRHPAATIHPIAADLSKRPEVDRLIAAIQAIGRPVDVLVNNAGVFLPGQIHNEAEGTLETLMQTNVYSAYHLTRGLLGPMMERKQGHLFMMGSTASIMAYPNGGSYCISKFALLGMAKVLREELKPNGIRVTTLLPGATLTNSWAGTDLPEERFMKASDVAEMVWAAYRLSAGAVVEEILLRPQLGDI